MLRTNLGNNFKGRKIGERSHLYVWETCSAEEFIRVWLPRFETGQLRPEQAPITMNLAEATNAELSA